MDSAREQYEGDMIALFANVKTGKKHIEEE